MKKRIAALLLALSMMTSTVLAVSDIYENFVRSGTYDGQFPDVAVTSPFYDNVAALYEYGLTVGRADGTFGPEAPVTVGQVVVFAGRLRSLYATGAPEEGAAAFPSESGTVYEPYLRYLQSLGVLGTELDGQYGDAATRKTAAHILANTLPEDALPDINGTLVEQAYATGYFIPDVTADTEYGEDILSLYRWGISQGSDPSGTFYPDASISRGALAALLTRLVDPALRVTPDWDLLSYYSAQGTTWGDLAEDAGFVLSPASQEEVAADVQYMLSQGSDTLTLQFSKVSAVTARQVMNQALSAVKASCEQCYNAVSCTYDTVTGELVLTFSATCCTSEQLAEYRAYTLDAAIAVHDQLWADGAITASMSEYEKAKVYYDWICRNCIYDYGAGEDSLSHIPYALFHDGVAVCDGYTGAYNLLLKLEGIQCAALANTSHIWTVAELDGTQYHIDTTWGDSSGRGTDYTYFAMTARQSWKFHSW